MEMIKRFIKGALEEGMKRQSPVTQFVHYTFEDPDSRDAIPIYENLVFILALCRSNQAELILEGRDLFLRLAHFFSPSQGFGVYLHEWPQVRKPNLNVRMLFPLIHLWKEYGHVFGNEARGKLSLILENLSCLIDSLTLSPIQAFQKGVFDAIYKEKEMPKFDRSILLSTKDWSEILPLASLLGEEIAFPWSQEHNCFGGAYLHELERTTLFDLFFGKAARSDEITPLYGALIYEFPYSTFVQEDCVTPFGVWRNLQLSSGLISYLCHYEPIEGKISPGHHLFSLVNKQAKLVCGEGRMPFCATVQEGCLIAEFTFQEGSDLDLFLSHHPQESLKVNGEKATYFELGDVLTIDGFEIVFEKVSGVGRLCGHFLRGNRKSRGALIGKNEWEAYDWQINLTALEKGDDLKVRAMISICEGRTV